MSNIEQTVVELSSKLRKMGFRVGVEESIDAANALRVLGQSDSELVEAAIKATLVKDFHFSNEHDEASEENSGRVVHFGVQEKQGAKGVGGHDLSERADENPGKDADADKFGMYSPVGIESRQKELNISRSEEKRWSEGISRFKISILTLEGHRFRKSYSGEINLRRTVRLELKKSGNSTKLFRAERKITKANVVLLCDVSGSMNASNGDMLKLCCSLKRAVPKSEIFVFSTKLKRITTLCARFGPNDLSLRVPRLDLGFGDGTKIGRCLEEFRRHYGHLLTRKTTVAIFSDGWDIGDISILRDEMKLIHKRANRVVWINPFLESKDYSVETLGMKSALEYIDLFIPPSSLLNG